jgi:hypothetical protein
MKSFDAQNYRQVRHDIKDDVAVNYAYYQKADRN